jgi:hypothetical protein
MQLLSMIGRVLKVKMSEVRLPSIEVFGPQPVEPSRAFNVQPDGRSAMWMRVESPPPAQATLIFGGTALATVVDDRIVTAAVPARLTAKPRKIPVWLEAEDVDGIRVSEPIFFEVVAP